MPTDSSYDMVVGSDWALLPLGALIQRARLAGVSKVRHTQKSAAKAVGIGATTMGAIEQGSRVPSLVLMEALASLLVPDEALRREVLPRWVAKWTEARAGDLAKRVDDDNRKADHQDLVDAADWIVRGLSPAGRRLPPAVPRSLEGFPELFQPLVAILPDRREVPPKSPADLFIRSGASTDYQFIPYMSGLDGPLRVLSHKLCVLMPEDWLRSNLGTSHLLVVGSAGVNWLTRTLADQAIFRPAIDQASIDWHLQFCTSKEFADLDRDDFLLSAFWHVLEHGKSAPGEELDVAKIPQERMSDDEIERLPEAVAIARALLRGLTATMIFERFWVPGFADPADNRIHGTLPGDKTDYGVISLAPNPYDDTGQFVSVVCAGIHGPGTAHAVKALATAPEKFANHPFGGVIKVRLPGRENWPARFEKASWQWVTSEYAPEQILRNLTRKAGRPNESWRPALQYWTGVGRGNTVRFIRQLMGSPE